MSNYSQITSFGPKDSLITGNPLKIVRGTELDAEFAAIATAIATKLDSVSFANPTATVGLTATNGVLSTPMRSDAAPALSQAIVPTWTGVHTFQAAPLITADHLSITNTDNYFQSLESDQGADGKVWWQRYNGGSLTWQTRTDALGAGTDALAFQRSGINVSSLIFGNATSNPTFQFTGTGNITAGGVHLGPDGAVGAPAFSFSGDTNTGIYRTGASTIGFSAGGTKKADVGTFGFRVASGILFIQDGSSPSPGFAFDADNDTGFYRIAANTFEAVAGAVRVMQLNSTAVIPLLVTNTNVDGTAPAPTYSFNNDPDTGFYRITANTVGFAAAGALTFQYDNLGVYNLDGSAAHPAYTFTADADTGFYRVGANRIGASVNGAQQLDITVSGVEVLVGQSLAPAGLVGTPGFAFGVDPDTGLYRVGANDLALATGGVKAFEIDSSQTLFDKNGIEIGYKVIPRSTTATTLAIGDRGKCVAITAAINIPASVFSAGDAISIYNDSAGALNITISAGTLRLSGTATTGTRSLAARGIATLWFNVGGATPEVIASGNVT